MLMSVLSITVTVVHSLSAATHLETTTVPALEGISATDSAAQVSKLDDHIFIIITANFATPMVYRFAKYSAKQIAQNYIALFLRLL